MMGERGGGFKFSKNGNLKFVYDYEKMKNGGGGHIKKWKIEQRGADSGTTGKFFHVQYITKSNRIFQRN